MTTLALLIGGATYKLGSAGDAVQAIQTRLRALGYPLKGTGYFGSATDTAVTAFQHTHGLVADGVVGQNTAQALDNAQGASQTATPTPQVQDASRPLWLTAGLALIGTKEAPGAANNPVILDWAKDEGGEIAKEYTRDETPWCALLANHILTLAGLKGTGTLWALDFAGRWPSVQLAGPAVGAFAPMLRNGGGHIICIVGRDQSGNVMGLGGNQSDAVNIKPFARSRLNKGFWWPAGVPLPTDIGFDKLPVVASDGHLSSNEA